MEKELDTKWYESFRDLKDAIKSWTLSQISNIINWPGKEDPAGAVAYFNSVVEAAMQGNVPAAGGAPAQANSAKAAPAQAPAPKAAGGLAAQYEADVKSKIAATKASAEKMGYP